MKEAYYFPHDANARTDAKILELRAEMGWEGYGLWWALVEQLREATDYRLSNEKTGGLAMGLNIQKKQLETLLCLCFDLGLLELEEGYFYSPSLRRRMVALDNKRLARAESARKAAEKRWNKDDDANALPSHEERIPDAMPIDATIDLTRVDLTRPNQSKEEEPSSLRSEDAAPAAASEDSKKKEGQEPVSESPAPADAPASHTRGAADVGTRIKRGKNKSPEPEHFAAFWQSYSRHDDRAAAVAAFRKLSEADQQAAAARADAWLKARPDLVSARGDFRPHPATWLNKTRWTDDAPAIIHPANAQNHATHFRPTAYANPNSAAARLQVQQPTAEAGWGYPGGNRQPAAPSAAGEGF